MTLKIEIQELFRDWEETELDLSIPADAEKILQKTSGKVGKLPVKQRKIRKTLLMAACLLLVLTTVAAVWRAIRYQKVDSVTITFGAVGDEVEKKEVAKNAIITFEPQNPPSRPNMVGFTLSWLPEHAKEFMKTTLGQRLEHAGTACELDPDLLNEAKTSIQYVVGESRNGQVINVDLYPSGEVSGRMFVPWGEMTLEKEGIFMEMEALWITMTMEDTTCHYLLLYHADYNCVIKIGTSDSRQEDPFEELERIAQGMTLVDSGVPSVDPDPDWNWIHLGVGLG